MSFLSNIKKQENKLKKQGISVSVKDPDYWISTGSYLINKIISGKYKCGIPQGRLSMIAGPSGAGKSFMMCNMVSNVMSMGGYAVYIDVENAIDRPYLEKINVDVDSDNFIYRLASSLQDIQKIVSDTIIMVRESVETETLPPIVIFIDSLDAIRTETQEENFEKGTVKGDQGQMAKQYSAMLLSFVGPISDLPISIVVTKQVYANQDMYASRNFFTKYNVTEKIQYPFSQVLMLAKTMLKSKDKSESEYIGINLIAGGYKTRFTKPFQKIKIEIPYDTGLDLYTGIFDAAKNQGIIKVESANGRYSFSGNKFTENEFNKSDSLKQLVFDELVKNEDMIVTLDDNIMDEVV